MRRCEGQTQFSLRVSQDSDCFIGLDRRRVYSVADGLPQKCLISAVFFRAPPRDVYDQSEQHSNDDRLRDKLLYGDVPSGYGERCVDIAAKSEKSPFPVRRKHQREQDGKFDG
jgi:hypothetical protein